MAPAPRGSLLGFVDADDMVAPGWVESMSGALGLYPFVAGRIDTKGLNHPNHAGARGIDQARGPGSRLVPYALSSRTWGPPAVAHGYMPYAMGCNLGVRREVFEMVGGFDVRYRAAEDVNLSWRIQLAGAPLHFEENALVHYRLPGSATGVCRQLFRQSQGPLLYRDFRHEGMPGSGVKGALYDYACLVIHPADLFRPKWRYSWMMTCGYRAGRLVRSLRHRTLFL